MHLISHLRGDIPLEDAAEQIKVDTRQLARRQAKWFRRFPGVTWLSGSADLETNAGAAISAWQSASHEAR
jgi:tRNA dimethylallyltransferase